MKPFLRPARLLLLLVMGTVMVLSPGCVNRYKVTLTGGGIIMTHSRPKYDKTADVFRFKDVEGKPRTIPSIRVKEIEPL